MGVLHFAVATVLVWHVAANESSCQRADETTLLQGVVGHHKMQSQPPPDGVQLASLASVAAHAWRFLYPLVIMAETRGRMPFNRITHKRTLSRPWDRQVVKPNVDTLYSTFWFDLPPNANFLEIHVPDTQGRYYVWQFMDMWTNTFVSLGPRTTGTVAQTFRLVGPGYTGDRDDLTLTAPTRNGWVILRIVCNGPDDQGAVNALQDDFTVSYSDSGALSLLNTEPSTTPPGRVDAMDAQTFFERASEIMAAGNMPQQTTDAAMISDLASVGIVPGEVLLWSSLSSSIRLSLTQGVSLAKATLQMMTNSAPSAEWCCRIESLGNWSDNYLMRSVVANTGLGANIPEDASYVANSHDTNLDPLTGAGNYRITFGPGQLPPVNAFWSVTAYGPENYLIPNSAGVQALGDRSGLVTATDGTTTIYLRHTAPEDEALRANWLPTPADGGDFSLTMRLYWPKENVLDGSWVAPEIMPENPE